MITLQNSKPQIELRFQEEVPMSSRAKEAFENSFLPRYKALQAEVQQESLVVLVWGPGPEQGELYEKRRQIRDGLRRREHAAVFSEEIEKESHDTDKPFSQKTLEFLQAQAADFVIVVQASFGSVAEVHDFADLIASKLLVFIDEQAIGGYSYRGALSEMQVLCNNVETYSYPEDIEECHLLSRAMKKVNVMQMTKYRARVIAERKGIIHGSEGL